MRFGVLVIKKNSLSHTHTKAGFESVENSSNECDDLGPSFLPWLGHDDGSIDPVRLGFQSKQEPGDPPLVSLTS